MGFFSSLFSLFSKKKQLKIIVIGLNNSGKTTIINQLKPKKVNIQEVTATVGYTIEYFQKNNINFTIFDMSGQGTYRDMWSEYCKDSQAIIFVVDANDKLRFKVAENELKELLKSPEINNKVQPILFYANKMDLKDSCTPQECMDQLNLQEIQNRSWNIVASNALSGEGIEEGMKWLISILNKK